MRAPSIFVLSLLIGIACLAAPLPVQAQDILPVPPAQGQVPGLPLADASAAMLPSAAADAQSLELVVQEYGQVTLSVDAAGTRETSTKIQVQKPANATVKKAYLLAATIWRGGQIAAGDVTLQGSPISWEREIGNSLQSYNYWADVTAVIKQTIDGAAPGTVDLTLVESAAKTAQIDGEILAVIFDDPGQTADNTILLYFGAQNVAGDTFNIEFGTPIDTDIPEFILDLSLGISYGYQTSSITSQYSRIDVNGRRLTSSAGGQDDGASINGGLITAGGIGDSRANPPDPNAAPTDARSDDELYDLRPFVKNGDTAIKIDTLNPSNDDNILFAAVVLGGTRTTNTVDLTVTLDNNPTTAEARAPYESVIRFLADGIYEETNGAHKLGRVTFYANGENSTDASIVWTTKEAGRPNAIPSGYRRSGAHINMYNVVFDFDVLQDEAHQKQGGYILAHEVGHYVYALYDEYAEDNPKTAGIIYMPHAKDGPVPNSVMNNPWQADEDTTWLNFSTAKNDTKQTGHYRVYGANGWATLVRTVDLDPPQDEMPAEWKRVYYSELAEVAPKSDELPRIDLPGDARSALRVRWNSPASLVTAAAGDLTGSEVTALPIPLSAHLVSLGGQNIAYPQPLVLMAFVSAQVYVTDLDIEATMLTPLGETRLITFTDDGIAPDLTAQDGLYSALVPYAENGIHSISVSFNNADGKALFVDTAFLPARPPGDVPYVPQPPQPVGEDFSFTQNLQVVVSNLVADDHGNTLDAATSLPNNNAALPSRIDYAGDEDLFQVTALDGGATYVRITNRGLNMQPYMRILAADGVTRLFAGTVEDSGGPYLYQRVEGVPAGTPFYVIVADVNASAAAGLYSISAGSPLASDPQATMLGVAATPSEIVADGVSTGKLQVTVQDASGLPIPNHSVTMSTDHGTLSPPSATNRLGVTSAVLTSSTTAVTATVVVTAGSISKTVQVSFVAGPPAAIELSAAAAELPADGESATTVTARVIDANGNVTKGRDVAFTATLGTISSPVATSADGVAAAVLRAGKVAGEATISATAGQATADIVIMLKQVIFNLYLPAVNK